MRCSSVTFSLALATALHGHCLAQMRWQLLPDAASPTPRFQAALAFDAVRGEVLMFGGNAPGGRTDETWSFDGARWRRLTPTSTPAARSTFDMVARDAHGDVILFGGVDRGDRPRNDTWRWNGQDWVEMTPARAPSPRLWNVLAYDSARDRVVLFGGYTGQSYLGDTWEWDGRDWLPQSPATQPSARAHFAMAYDRVRRVTVLFGGHANAARFNDTWEWDGADWTPRSPARSPSPRASHQMAFDPMRGHVVLFAGWEGTWLDDAWAWDGTTWSPVTPCGASRPAILEHVELDRSRNRFVVIAGSDGEQTWTAMQVGEFVPFGSACAGTVGPPRLAAAPGALPRIGATFTTELRGLPTGVVSIPTGVLGFSDTTWGSTRLPFALDGIGMAGCALLVDPAIAFTLVNQAGTARWDVAIPDLGSLCGAVFYEQGFVFDFGANALGVIASNGGRAVITSQ